MDGTQGTSLRKSYRRPMKTNRVIIKHHENRSEIVLMFELFQVPQISFWGLHKAGQSEGSAEALRAVAKVR